MHAGENTDTVVGSIESNKYFWQFDPKSGKDLAGLKFGFNSAHNYAEVYY